MIYFTADPHYGHSAIIDYCNRPFKNVDVMNATLIRNWNNVVTDSDTVYVIGDFSMKGTEDRNYIARISNKLNGTKHLILGNHDNLKPFAYTDIGFKTVHTALELNVGDGETWLLHHDPVASITAPDKIWICGHVHQMFKYCKNAVNVGVDVWNYTPVSINTVRNFITKEGI